MSEIVVNDDADTGTARRRLALTPVRTFVALVILPTLLCAAYLFLFASNQYQSRTAFVIRGMQPEPAAPGGLGQILGIGSAVSGAQREAQGIREFLLSWDAVLALKARGLDVAALYSRDSIDPLSRLDPAALDERVLDYYRKRVDVSFNPDDGITRVAVRAFAPAEAQAIARALLAMGEDRVNRFNTRAIASATRSAEDEVGEAESELNAIQGRLTGFRDLTGDLDPQANSAADIRQQSEQESELARQRAILADMRNYLSADAPQVVAMRSRVAALEGQLGAQRASSTGSSQSQARRLAEYEQLKLRQEFAAKRYDLSRASLESARSQGDRQRLFIVAITEPNRPERPYAPRPLRTTATIFAGLLAAFAIGWLLLAGVREHRA